MDTSNHLKGECHMATPQTEKSGEQAEMYQGLKQNRKSVDSIVTQCKAMKLNIEAEKAMMQSKPEVFAADDIALADDLVLYFKNELKTVFTV